MALGKSTTKNVKRSIWLGLFLLSANVGAEALSLAAAPFETYVADDGEPSRINSLLHEAFAKMDDTQVDLQIMREAFLGSAVRAKRVDGEFAYIDLGEKQQGIVLSRPYLPLTLYATGKGPEVENVKLFPHLKGHRVAIENRFANTPTFRLLKNIKWSRNPSTYDAFRQLADDRAPFLITSKLLIDEFNLLLSSVDEELLRFSAKPLLTSGFRLALHSDVPNAQGFLSTFNAVIDAMQQDGSYNRLLGIHWLLKDVNSDGVADFIANSRITTAASPLSTAYALDNSLPSETSLFIVDGVQYADFDQAKLSLTAPVTPRESLLDPELYDLMLKRW